MFQACTTHYSKKCHVEYEHREAVKLEIKKGGREGGKGLTETVHYIRSSLTVCYSSYETKYHPKCHTSYHPVCKVCLFCDEETI